MGLRLHDVVKQGNYWEYNKNDNSYKRQIFWLRENNQSVFFMSSKEQFFKTTKTQILIERKQNNYTLLSGGSCEIILRQ